MSKTSAVPFGRGAGCRHQSGSVLPGTAARQWLQHTRGHRACWGTIKRGQGYFCAQHCRTFRCKTQLLTLLVPRRRLEIEQSTETWWLWSCCLEAPGSCQATRSLSPRMRMPSQATQLSPPAPPRERQPFPRAMSLESSIGAGEAMYVRFRAIQLQGQRLRSRQRLQWGVWSACWWCRWTAACPRFA
jgi:hypothetical protein